MSKIPAYDVFSLYIALKAHFKQRSYDFFKYHGKTSISQHSFESRNDKRYFYRLSSTLNSEDVYDLLISNLYHDPDIWVGDIVNDTKCKSRMFRRQIYANSTEYRFKEDLDKIFNSVKKPELAFHVDEYGTPPIFRMLLDETIDPETFIILNDILLFTKNWNEKVPLIWPDKKLALSRYADFVKFDHKQLKNILKKRLTPEVV